MNHHLYQCIHQYRCYRIDVATKAVMKTSDSIMALLYGDIYHIMASVPWFVLHHGFCMLIPIAFLPLYCDTCCRPTYCEAVGNTEPTQLYVSSVIASLCLYTSPQSVWNFYRCVYPRRIKVQPRPSPEYLFNIYLPLYTLISND